MVTSQKAASPSGPLPTTNEKDTLDQLLQEKPLNPLSILVHEPSINESSQYVSIVLNQLSILLATASAATWKSHHDQIRYILSNERKHHIVHSYFYSKLVAVVKDTPHTASLSPPEQIFKAELEYLAKDCTFIEFLIPELSSILGNNATEQIFYFIERFSIDPVLLFTFVLRIADPESPAVKHFFEEASSKVPALVIERSTTSDRSWCHVLLDCILRSPTYPFLHKLSTIGQFNAFDLTIPPVQAFFRSILKMTFKELLIEIGPENLLPEKLLPSLLQIKPEDADESIALVLAEVLIPGSQGLTNTNGGITPLTFVNNLPEANAKGAQLQACLKNIEQNKNFTLNWFAIFSKVQELLFDASKRNSQPSVASITQLFSALDFKQGLIDIVLSYEWWFDKTLLFMLQSMYTKPGAFDIMNSKNLTLCYEGEVSSEHELLKFVNIAKLEVQVMSKINTQSTHQNKQQSEGDRKLETWLTQFFDLHCRSEPHHVIAGALAIPDKDSYILDRIDRLFAFMMDRPWTDENVAQLGKVINKFKELDIQLAILKLIEFYTSRVSPESLTKVVQTATSFELFDELTSKAKLISYSLYLAFVVEASTCIPDTSSYAEGMKHVIENDVRDPKLKNAVYQSLLEILESRAAQDFEAGQQQHQQQQQGAPPSSLSRPLKVSVVYLLLDALKGSQGLVDPERLKNLQLSLLTTYPRLINFGIGHDKAIMKNEEMFSNFFPPQVEQEMKSCYSKMYSKDMDIKEIVEMLGRMKNSDVPHEQDVFSCMIHSLIDEYRFFSEYPLTALASTSLLFGALLQKDLIQGTTLTVALNFIWESCNQPQDSHMFKFAVQSLYNFKSRLHEYPMYCKHLLKCQSLSAHAKMYQIVKDASNGIPCPDSNAPQQVSVSDNQVSKSEGVAVNYNSISAVKRTIGFEAQEDPAEAISDRLLFFVNNMTSDNMLTKLADIKGLFAEKYFSWFANYLVTERARIEPNNHTLYTSLVFALNNPIFYEYVLNITLFEVGKLLRNFKDTSSERQHLKNLGAWLGKITLANDRPLKRDQVALKYLLVESFDFKTLHIVIPFVCKILEQASYSRVFRCPNPWVLGVIKVLVELYECADLKLNLKFEIEVLLNAFDTKVKDIEASTLIRTHNPKPEALAAMFGTRTDVGGMIDLAALSIEGPNQSLQMQQHLQQQAAMMQQQQQQQQQQHLSQLQHLPQIRQMDDHVPQTSVANQLDASFSNLVGNTIFTQNPNLRRAFQVSLACAVRECAVPILSRVSEAVLSTTEALVRKDFATEADSAKFRKSYQIMAQQLAHSMVVCSGRKILSEAIEATMVQLLSNQINANELPLLELNSAIQSNVHLCVEIVENLAATNISELIEERMHQQVLVRERHTKGEPFRDEGASTYALQLPPPLGLKPDGLHDTQLNIYTGFGTNSFIIRADQAQGGQQLHPISNVKASPLNQNVQAIPQQIPQRSQQPPFQSASKEHDTEHHEISHDFQLRSQDSLRGNNIDSQLTPQQVSATILQEDSSADQLFSFITQLADKAIQTLAGIKETSLHELPADHPILQSLSQALALCQSNAVKYPELLLKVAQYAVNCLFTQVHENPMSNEIYVVILDKLCECSPSTAKDVTWWMVHSLDQRKFNMPVIFSLLKVQLVTPLKLDSSIGKLIAESNSAVLVKFASSLLLNVFSSEGTRPIALRSEFACTLDALLNYDPEDTEEHQRALAMRNDLFKLLNESNIPLSSSTENKEGDGFVQMGYIFVEWVKLVGHNENSLALQNAFVDRLFHCGVLNEPEKFQTFFRAATEISTTAFVTEHEMRSRTQREVLLSVDCLALLISRILLRFSKSHTEDATAYMKIIFDIIALVLVNEHEGSKSTWNERAYFKLFSSLMCTWSEASVLDADATSHLDLSFYSSLGDVLDSVQPLIYPGFTFAWISLIAHRMFLPKLLELPEKNGYSVVVKLLTSLLKFQNVYSKDKFVQHDVLHVIFKAINRVFTALAHDEPEFLIECHYQLITAVPSVYIQVKNIILSAIPKTISAESPFSRTLNCNDLPGCSDAPGVQYAPITDLSKAGLKKPVENFIRIPASALLRTIYGGLKLNYPKEVSSFGFDSVNFNTRLVNALALHVVISAVEDKLPRDNSCFNSKSSHTSLLVDLMNHGCTEFRYHLMDAIANQLRSPNCHTQWFISFVLHIFSDEASWSSGEIREEMDEIVARVLLERHLVNKPYPWGLSMVLTELVSNEKYDFFSRLFHKNTTPELRGVFEALAKTVR
ncbi:Not1-domain-containing protein [Metschnikowia bicuspidata var. bicuspidata NRRL YB-4993]|uniref:Not1-domain-containing protein n=1 Tax=Metschnikowia bicuspidata var. bicuspidata NRRL YB-4993 TaxID=869754 RepID=A0A1A0HB80_9ASCO|nr:Not1-domain-containing protein [Metschnikowia bicuspidata var. bicuspidata NRRL YB-4993]OBA21148.1 Not1-domain-containing protein [Metschnikowia bicuspidata var. bicuspidata NRRL YB-4993]